MKIGFENDNLRGNEGHEVLKFSRIVLRSVELLVCWNDSGSCSVNRLKVFDFECFDDAYLIIKTIRESRDKIP